MLRVFTGLNHDDRAILNMPSYRAFSPLAGARQSDLKNRPVRLVRGCLKASAVRFDDRPTNGKSYPHSFGFCREERLKDTLQVLTIYSCPGVFNGDHNSRRSLSEIGAYPQQPRAIVDRVHRFDCICNQIQEHFFQLRAIGK